MQSNTDPAIEWRAFQNGEPQAEEAIFNRLFRALCYYAEKITDHQGQAEDIVAESFIKAFAAREKFEGEPNLKRFLYRIVRNQAINYKLQTQNRSTIHDQLKHSLESEMEDGEAIDLEQLRAELLAAIYHEVEELPDKCRTIFKMIFVEGLSNEQIATSLNINVQTVRSQKSRAIELLRTRLLKDQQMMLFLLLFLADIK
jgi:RNA polymerase sigma-70 factor (family 1)